MVSVFLLSMLSRFNQHRTPLTWSWVPSLSLPHLQQVLVKGGKGLSSPRKQRGTSWMSLGALHQSHGGDTEKVRPAT